MATVVDSNTLALWRLDDAPSLVSNKDDKGSYLLDQGTTVSTQLGKVDNALLLNGTSQYRGSTNAVAVAGGLRTALLAGVWAIDGWLQLSSSPPAADQTLFCFGGASGASTGNELARVYLNSSRVLCLGWQNGTNVAVGPAVDPSASVWAASTPYRFGVSVNIPGSLITFWRDGVKLGQVTTSLALPTDGSLGLIYLGRRANSATTWLKGWLDHVALLSVAPNDATMQARAASNLVSTAKGNFFKLEKPGFNGTYRSPVARFGGAYMPANYAGVAPECRPISSVVLNSTQVRVYVSSAINTAVASLKPGFWSVTGDGAPAITAIAFESTYFTVTLDSPLPKGQAFTLNITLDAFEGTNGAKVQPAAVSFTSFVDPNIPTVSNVSPTPGTALTPSTPISFRVTDVEGLKRVVAMVRFEGRTEVVHDGEAFSANYTGPENTRTPRTGGFDFTILRNGGWLEAPTLKVIATDTAGQEDE